MTVGLLARQFRCSTIGALLLMACSPSLALAQSDHMHGTTSQPQPLTPDQKAKAGALIKVVREATERFQNPVVDVGAMGLHFVNGSLVGDGELDVNRPEIVLYEPLANGRLRLTGADYLVLADAWNAKHAGPPELMGQLFHLFDSPNRFGLPAFYTLHVWAWKENPNGAFTNWNPNISCENFAGQDR
jgi:hypothetical protein